MKFKSKFRKLLPTIHKTTHGANCTGKIKFYELRRKVQILKG